MHISNIAIMKQILNYKTSPHFIERINQRQIEPFLVAMCLAKGKMTEKKKKKKEFVLSIEQIMNAVKQEYVSMCDYRGLVSITVIARSNVLITAFGKYGDTGISNLLSL